jgi:hypothetical protein
LLHAHLLFAVSGIQASLGIVTSLLRVPETPFQPRQFALELVGLLVNDGRVDDFKFSGILIKAVLCLDKHLLLVG